MNNPFLQALKSKPFLYLWLSEVFSQIAVNMMNFILILVAFSLTNSNTAVSGIVLSFTIPAIIFGILAGVYVDRWNKKKVLFLTNIIRFAILVLLAAFHTKLPLLYFFSFVVAIVTQFFIPAETPMIPLLVKKEHLIAANALFSTAWFGSVFVAYALAGPVVLLLGHTISFILLSAVFLCASIFALLIEVPDIVEKTRKSTKQLHIFIEIRNALTTIFQIREVRHAFSMLMLSQILTYIISIVGPGYARNILHINVNAFPLIFITPAVIGMATGAYVMANSLDKFSRHKSATLGLFIATPTIFCLAFSQQIAGLFTHILPFSLISFAVSFAFLLGFANALIFIPSNTLIQEHSTDQIRGKIYGALNTISALLSLVPIIVVGSLADIFGVGTVLCVIGFVIGLIGVIRLIIT